VDEEQSPPNVIIPASVELKVKSGVVSFMKEGIGVTSLRGVEEITTKLFVGRVLAKLSAKSFAVA
jgi:hypothetical protein